jgi:gluconokinase
MFVLIMGVPGFGKTTVGMQLSAAIVWPFYDADDFHSPVNVCKKTSGVPITDDDRAPWLDELRALMSERGERGENG